MKTLVSQITRPLVLWVAIAMMALIGLGSVVELRAQSPIPKPCGGSCLPGACTRGCICSGLHGQCVSL
jgi:hypothetical protein